MTHCSPQHSPGHPTPSPRSRFAEAARLTFLVFCLMVGICGSLPATVSAASIPAVSLAGPVFAQQPAQQPGGSGSTSAAVGPSRNLFLEYFLILLLVGGALFAVCRSSQRI